MKRYKPISNYDLRNQLANGIHSLNSYLQDLSEDEIKEHTTPNMLNGKILFETNICIMSAKNISEALFTYKDQMFRIIEQEASNVSYKLRRLIDGMKEYQCIYDEKKDLCDKFVSLAYDNSEGIKYSGTSIEESMKRDWCRKRNYFSGVGVIIPHYKNIMEHYHLWNTELPTENVTEDEKGVPLRLPKVFSDINKAKTVFEKLKNEEFLQNDTELNHFLYWFGLMDDSNGVPPLKWNGNRGYKALLAYFISSLFCKGRSGVFPDNAASEAFGVNGLKQACYQYSENKKTGGKPKGYNRIDDILKEHN